MKKIITTLLLGFFVFSLASVAAKASEKGFGSGIKYHTCTIGAPGGDLQVPMIYLVPDFSVSDEINLPSWDSKVPHLISTEAVINETCKGFAHSDGRPPTDRQLIFYH